MRYKVVNTFDNPAPGLLHIQSCAAGWKEMKRRVSVRKQVSYMFIGPSPTYRPIYIASFPRTNILIVSDNINCKDTLPIFVHINRNKSLICLSTLYHTYIHIYIYMYIIPYIYL